MSKENTVTDLPEDIEVVGPGQMLVEAREKLGFSQQQVADKLNFRATLVKEIEQDIFDKTLPDTFNRGYLKNYAKLVNISIDEVLASYEMLNVAEQQGAEMQSFSKETQKQAESNRIIWLSYFILALLVGATIVWWLQDAKQNQLSSKTPAAQVKPSAQKQNATAVQADNQEPGVKNQQTVNAPVNENSVADLQVADAQPKALDTSAVEAEGQVQELAQSNADNQGHNQAHSAEQAVTEKITADSNEQATDFGPIESVQFTFSGDCWVNIYDATGERIAWGIKKAGYVMNITGQAPFTITLGKPELVSILFEQQAVDMSQFSRGNIAKFSLPIE